MCLATALTGCGSKPTSEFGAPEQLTLYSIDGRDSEPGQKPQTEETFHHYPVLGKVELTDAEQRRELLAALQSGIDSGDRDPRKCFWPRHAIRTVEKSRTREYVICFQCRQMYIYEDGSESRKPITDQPQPRLNKFLQEAGVPLAPR
jgi:hypothetical protein